MAQWTALLGVVVWPLVVLVSVILFRKVLRDVLVSDSLSVSGPGGISFSAQRAAGALVDASAAKSPSGQQVSTSDAQGQVEEVATLVRRLRRTPRLLWVDDRPSSNRQERLAVESMGMLVDLSTSTEDAQHKLGGSDRYDAVISDMARPDDPHAGYALLSWMRGRGDRTPYIIYSASNSDEAYDEAVAKGALGSTADPRDLIDLILCSLRSAQRRSRWPFGR